MPRRLGAIFGLALLVRVIAAVRMPVIFNDGPVFIKLAWDMEAGDWAAALTHQYHPLYSLSIAALHSVLADWETAAIAISVVSGAVAVIALYAFLRAAYDERLAAVGAVLLALHPYSVRFSADVQSDSLYLALFLAAVACLFRALKAGQGALAFAAGCLTGLAYLTRPEGIGVALVGSVMAAAAWLRASWSPRHTLAWLASLWLGVAFAAAPYLLAIRSLSGHWSMSRKKSVLEIFGMGDGLPGAMTSGENSELGLPLWVVAPLASALLAALVVGWHRLARQRSREGRRVRIGARGMAGMAVLLAGTALLLAPEAALIFSSVFISALRPEILLLIVIGLASRVRHGPQGRALFISAFQGLYAVVLFGLLLHYGYLSRRHVMPPLSLLFGYAALGLVLIAERLPIPLFMAGRSTTGTTRLEGSSGRSSSPWLAGLLVAMALISLPKALSDYRFEELAGRVAAEWLRDQESVSGRIAGKKSKLGYYSGLEWRPLVWNGERRTLFQLKYEDVRWVIAEADAVDELGAPTGPLVANDEVRLVERHRVEAAGRLAVVFELVEQPR